MERKVVFLLIFYLMISVSFAGSEGKIKIILEEDRVKQGEFLGFEVEVNKTEGVEDYAFFDYWIEALKTVKVFVLSIKMLFL